MSEPKTIIDEKPTQQTPTAESELAFGRTHYESAMDKQDPIARRPELEEAVGHFQASIRMAPDSLEGYGWLAQTYRMLAASTRASDPDQAEFYTRFACAVAWEGSSRSTSPAATPIRVKQEVRTLIAWLRTTRHLSPEHAEEEMKTLREQCLDVAIGG